MNGLNSVAGNGEKGEEMAVGLHIKVTHGLNLHEVAVPSNSTFGDLKSVLAKKIGLNPETHMLLFQGEETRNDENLQTTGVGDNSKMLLVEDKACSQKSPEFNKDNVMSSRGCAAVAEVTAEVDKLSEKISALQATLNSGIKVESKDIIYLTEMLMRQLLNLDGIEAEGEGKVQRKMEVRRIQSFVETMDVIKSRNSNPFGNVEANVPVATQWETFEPDWGSATASAIPSIPAPTLTAMPTILTSTPTASPSSISAQVSASSLSQAQFSSPSRVSPVTYPTLSSPSIHNPSPAPVQNPSSTPTKMQFFAPMPSSTKVTEEWVQFD